MKLPGKAAVSFDLSAISFQLNQVLELVTRQYANVLL